MTELDDFLEEVLPRLRRTETSLHDGDPDPRYEMWSHEDPVTLYGAAMVGRGWDEVAAVFAQIASRFSECESCEWEVVAAGVSGDLGYIVAVERTRCSIGGVPSQYALRSTTVLRREEGSWKVCHRHANPVDDPAASAVEALLPS